MLIGLILGVSVGIIAIATLIYVLIKKYRSRKMKEKIKKEITGSHREHKMKIKKEAEEEFKDNSDSLAIN